MIVDTSALIAIMRNESENDQFSDLIAETQPVRISAATLLETGIVIDGYQQFELSETLDQFMRASSIMVEPVTEHLARLARQAYQRFGRGNGHPARLNFGDCFSYALAIDMNEPLLFKGNDFIHIDVRLALPSTN